MRAQEFVVEAKVGSVGKRRSAATRGLITFSNPASRDKIYELNRVMMAVASSDGTTPLNIPSESWVGRENTAHPYTEVELAMLKQAFATIGSTYADLNNGNMDSEELKSTNTQSPVKGFKGYPR